MTDATLPSKDVLNPTGPPFTVGRYGSLGACITAERDWLRAGLEDVVKSMKPSGFCSVADHGIAHFNLTKLLGTPDETDAVSSTEEAK